MSSEMKVLYMTNIPAPYRVDFFNELGKYCDLTVAFERKQATDRDKTWTNYNNNFYKKIELSGMLFGNDSAISLGVIRHLANNKYDIIIVGGYSTPTAMLTILYMKIKKIPFILNADGGVVKKGKKVAKLVKKFFIGSAHTFLSTGQETDKYLVHYGAKKNRIYHYPFTSIKQNSILKTIPTREMKDRLKEELGIAPKKVVISVGQFIHRKGFDVLIKAMANVKDALLYIIGGKPTEEYLTLIREYALTNVIFLPFMEQRELFRYYQMADIFALPTREDIWGLVINEAMAQGLPVITTERCVAGIELVHNGKNGFIVPIEDENELSDKINIILQDDVLRSRMAEESLNIIQNYSIEQMAQRHLEIFIEYRGAKNESGTNK